MRRLADDASSSEFRDFVIGSQTRLIKFAEFLTRDLGHAEDLVQHAYAKVFASWSKLRSGHPEAYARRCIVNGNTDRWRRAAWKEQPLDDAADGCAGTSLSADNAERDAVMRALGQLTKKERTVIALRYYCDLPTDDIARELGISAATVRTTEFRALAKLREDRHLVRDGGRA